MSIVRKVGRREVLALLNAAAFALPLGLPRLGFAQEAAPSTGEGATQSLDVPIEKDSRITVPIFLGGQGPFDFVVNTSSERTIIASELAEQLKLPDGPKIDVHTMNGRTSTPTAVLPQFELNGHPLAPTAAPKFSERHIGAKGAIGIDALKSQRIVLDFKNATMTMNAEPRMASDWEGETITVTARSKLGQLVLTNAGIGTDDDQISVIIDTGSQVSVGNNALKRFMQRTGALTSFRTASLISITGDVTPVDYVVVKRLRVGGMVVANLPIAFADVHPFRRYGLNRERALLLGMDMLQLFDQIGLNFQKRTVQFFWKAGAKANV